MTIAIILKKLDELNVSNDNISDIFIELLNIYERPILNFIFYDKYKYIHLDTAENKIRRQQYLFRKQLIDRYKKCIITGTSVSLCDAAHIIPYCDSDNDAKYDVNNGLLLVTDLHKMFDNGNLKINPITLKIELSDYALYNDDYKRYHKYHNMSLNITLNIETIGFLIKKY